MNNNTSTEITWISVSPPTTTPPQKKCNVKEKFEEIRNELAKINEKLNTLPRKEDFKPNINISIPLDDIKKEISILSEEISKLQMLIEDEKEKRRIESMRIMEMLEEMRINNFYLFSILIIRALLTIPKKILGFIFFPFVYPFRNKIYRATNAYTETRWQIDEVEKHNKGWKLFIWFFFDDSIYSDYRLDYHPTKHKCFLAELICKIFSSEGGYVM